MLSIPFHAWTTKIASEQKYVLQNDLLHITLGIVIPLALIIQYSRFYRIIALVAIKLIPDSS